MGNNIEEKSFSLGRLDIVDLYEWHTNNKLIYETYFQRQFVWKDKDKKDLIDTIIKGYPIPAIFICDAKTNYNTLTKTYNVLDGRQRLESIFEFLDNKYDYKGKRFNEMEEEEKKRILNYNIILIQMYIEPNETEKIKEIFKRLNKNAYNLNKMEKQSTQLVEYDYMIIAKIVAGIVQIEKIDDYVDEIKELFLEEDDKLEVDNYDYDADLGANISNEIKSMCKLEKIKYINKILTSDIVFSHYDKQRQIALQYFLNIYACIIKGELINRNLTEKLIIQFSELDKKILEEKLHACDEASKILLKVYDLEIDEFWKNKTSFFTLEILLAENLEKIEYISENEIVKRLNNFQRSNSKEWNEYSEASKQGVNDKKIREQRQTILSKVLFGQ
ncbi:Uncharacterized conserved protein [Anaerostipes hadrus]|uniref:Uncharacterized conserved protein n=1 Tax=Anaerostipes hadrus TaxID=649756 RepID=A0A174ULA0_ANAHA|nr:DUF262 domain-containing protein [Anaerostipes hadrus]CUQ23213.1 Uncharacterized conserved protein [Anaerostipes hadrus]